MTGPAYDRGTIAVLWWRDLLLFFHQRSRLIGALLTTLLLWLAIGAGIAPSFVLSQGDVGYMEYFFPGVIMMLAKAQHEGMRVPENLRQVMESTRRAQWLEATEKE